MQKYKSKNKLKSFLDKHFYRIFSNSHLLFTLIFFLSSLLIGLLSIFRLGDGVLFIATLISLTFLFLMIIGLIPGLDTYLFSEERVFQKNKIIVFIFVFFIGFIITLIYFLTGYSQDLPIEFMGWNLMLPVLYIAIFFGWNLTQIFFLRSGMEDISQKVENKLIKRNSPSKKQESVSLIFLIIAIIIPFLLFLGIYFGFLPQYTAISTTSSDPFIWFVFTNLAICIILIITSCWQISLFIKSKKYEKPNVYSSVFYIFIWLYLLYRTFSFLNALLNVFESINEASNFFTSLIDILLMLFTAVLVLRSLGGKIWGIKLFNKNNTPFFLYAFTLLYIAGQIIMVIGAGDFSGTFSNLEQIKMVNNFIIMIITICFYMYYSSYLLQRKGYIMKSYFTNDEVVNILKEYRIHLENRGYINNNELGWSEFQFFLDKQKLNPKEDIKQTDHNRENKKEESYSEE